MGDTNIILANTWFYNKYIKSKNDDKFNIDKAKIQYVNQDSMFSNIIDINNLDSVIIYDENRISDIPKTLNDYYQKYPIIDLNNKTILNTIYNIYNITDLKNWLNNNKNKNITTINRILDISWFEFNKNIYYDIDYFKEYYYELYHKNYKNITLNKIKDIIDNIIQKYNIKYNHYISLIINKRLK